MPKVRLTEKAVLQDGNQFREFNAGDVVERPAEWCRKWVEAGRAQLVEQAAPETAADTDGTPRRGRTRPESR